MNINSKFILMMAIFLFTGVLSGIWLSTSPIHAQINNQTSAATIDQLASNLTPANSELPINSSLK
jgi:hypothetical protein